jgi:putative sterol carrier protein
MNMSPMAKHVMAALPDAFLPEKATNVKGLIQFNLTGDGGGQWVLDVSDGKCAVREEVASKPDATLTIGADDFVALYSNKLNPMQAFMGGKVKVSGNVGLVMQLLNWFDRGA